MCTVLRAKGDGDRDGEFGMDGWMGVGVGKVR